MDFFTSHKYHRSELQIGLKLLASIVGIEALIMFSIDLIGFEHHDPWVGVTDALLLGFISSGLIYYWVVKPSAADQHRLFSSIVNNLSVGVVVTREQYGGKQIVAVNPAFTDITGYEAEEVLGQHPSMLLSDDIDFNTLEETRQSFRENRPVHVVQKNRHKDGSIFWNNLHLSPVLNSRGDVSHWVGLIDDISEQKKMEQELIHAQRMEAVGTLAGGIAHDFNNLLAAILGNLFLMKKDVKDRPMVTERIKTIESQGRRAAEMIRQMLTFARKGEINKKLFDLNPFAKELDKYLGRKRPSFQNNPNCFT